MDEFGDVSDKSSESYQTSSIILFIIVIISFIILSLRKKCLSKFSCCKNDCSSPVGKYCHMFWCCSCCDSICCHKCLLCIIDIAVNQSLGDELKKELKDDMKVEDIASENNKNNNNSLEIEMPSSESSDTDDSS